MRKRIVTLMLGMVITAGLVAGCSSRNQPTSERIKSITVATSPGYAPFEYKDEEGNLVGYEVDIWNEFEERTGIEVNWEYADFSGLLGLLDTKKADIVSAQLGPNPDRVKNYDFSEPISYSGYVVVVASDNKDIQSFDDLAGKTIGMGSGSNAETIVKEKYPNNEVNIEFYTSATLENQYADLEYKRIDAVIAQNVQVYQALEKGSIQSKVLDPAISSNPSCFVMSKDQDELMTLVNDFIKEIKEDGTLQEISMKWIGTDITKESK